MNLFSWIFIITLLLGAILQWTLTRRQIGAVQKHRAQVPDAFSEQVTLAEHQKAADYTQVKAHFSLLLLPLEVLLLLAWTVGGLLNGLDQFWQTLGWSPVWTGVAVLLSFLMINHLIELPAGYYRTFKIESRFDFNRSNLKLFINDNLKGLVLMLLIGTPLAALVFWLMESAGSYWWLTVWLVWMSFSLLMLWAYPSFIAPLFNKFNPLEEGELKQRIEHLLQRNGLNSDGIFVMDGSKRSGHGNAYFTGLGKNKRIVFYDTLLEGLEAAEVEAVLAHEIGHFKRKHVVKRLVMMAVLSLSGLFLLAWLMQQNWFYLGLGVTEASSYMALILFMLVLPVFTAFISPIMARLSRKHEFEADDFAAQQADAQDLIRALVKMYRENASTLTPDACYSAFYDSHPPAPVRIAHLSQ
ncbi:M48 family metallopeptidase [Candidatus Venteria ishoeyi]|uniref:M48 family metallopeptidase n=1 Tax=Candidatus Venteria ishoeyi TaxID=1899563 RepID=UPI0025A513E0|nr:M48 family metallopeptidase [Candidatus Venteria ishoeyi]MDM8546047.1 M48 family metallopeptidase [Candidatus Venteria ishoeyi]